jgi:hypothetical protein
MRLFHQLNDQKKLFLGIFPKLVYLPKETRGLQEEAEHYLLQLLLIDQQLCQVQANLFQKFQINVLLKLMIHRLAAKMRAFLRFVTPVQGSRCLTINFSTLFYYPVMKPKALEALEDPAPQPSNVGASNAAPVPATTTGVSETVACIKAVWPGYKHPTGEIGAA